MVAGEVVGANVVFAGRERRFTADEIDELELLTQIGAAGIVKAGEGHPSLAGLLRGHHRAGNASGEGWEAVTEVGPVRPEDPLGAAVATWQELVAGGGGKQLPGWGTLVRAGLPYEPVAAPDKAAASPFTPRERETAGLLALGLSDREVATHLVLSRKTVEKHVGAVLRKTGTGNRTAAVMAALARGWLPA